MQLDWGTWPAGRRRSAVLLFVMLGLALAGLAPNSGPADPDGPSLPGDAASYSAILEQMRLGAGYYNAAHAVLLADGYGTLSVFNWRMPGWPTLVAALPPGGAQLVLILLALAALLLVFRLVRNQSGVAAGLLALAAVGASLAGVAAPEAVLFSEVAAGMLVLLSVAAHAGRLPSIAIACGILALFVRELAAPYVLVAMLHALFARRWRPLAGWIVGLALFLAFFGWHWLMVAQQLGPADRAYSEGWVQFGGLDFVLSTLGFNGLWSLAPDWTRALLLSLGLSGLLVGRIGTLAFATVVAYVAAFSIVGKPFNAYWGALYTPVLMLGVSMSMAVLLPAGRDRPAGEVSP